MVSNRLVMLLATVVVVSSCAVITYAAPQPLSVVRRVFDALPALRLDADVPGLPMNGRQILPDGESLDEEGDPVLPESSSEAEESPESDTEPDDATEPGAGAENGDSPVETMEASQDPSSDDEVCVDARYLSSVPSARLVHPKHFSADVLCPTASGRFSSLPCATRNHLVLLDGAPLSYAQLCELPSVHCRSDRLLVNSVLSHLWIDEPHQNGAVHLTMLDARHPALLQRTLHRLVALRRSLI